MEERNKRMPLWLLIVLQLLLTAAVLCIFALFHHVIPRWLQASQGMPAPIASVEYTETPAPAAQPLADEPEETPAPEVTAAPEITEKPRPLTWRERYADQLAEEPTWEETSYRSPDMAVTITKYEYTETSPDSVYYAADIFLTDVEQLRSIFPLAGTFAQPVAVARDADAILAVNSDVFVNQRFGFVVRDGEIYNQNKTTADICVLYHDGSLATYAPEDYQPEEVIEAEPWQIWHFGPMLLDENGEIPEDFNISGVLKSVHPRTAIGYYEPGHYCFVVVDGRQSYSRGADIRTLAAIMKELGCKAAYNLDGGASSVMIFHGELVNQPCGERNLNDLIALVEAPREEEASE